MRKTVWFQELESKYKSGISNFFIMTGNINDYPVPNYLFKDYLFDMLHDLGMEEVTEFSLTKGFKWENQSMSTNRIFYLVDAITSKDKKRAIVCTHPEFLFPNAPAEQLVRTAAMDFITLYDAVNSKEFIKSDNILIFLTESKHSINNRFFGANTRSHLIEVGFPTESQRLEFAEYLEKTSHSKPKYEISLNEFARLTAGLTLVGMEDIYLQAEALGVLKKEFIMERKKELISKEYGEVIEILDADGFTFDDFAGQEHLKKYHKEVIINPMLKGQTDIVPKGLLYTGPPGTGKTHFARCLSGEAGINFVELKMSKILDKWVGESEKRFEKALTCIKSIAPVGVFIDEIDQAFSRGENESNAVSRNLFGMFLSVLSEPKHRGQIIWIGAANYPNRIDEALKRTGRFDKKMPFLPPNKDDRIKVMKIHLNRAKLKNNITEPEFEALAALTDKYTQAELEGIVVKALELAIRKGKNEILFEDMKLATELIVTTQNKNIDEMIQIAINECNDLEFMPKEYKKS